MTYPFFSLPEIMGNFQGTACRSGSASSQTNLYLNLAIDHDSSFRSVFGLVLLPKSVYSIAFNISPLTARKTKTLLGCTKSVASRWTEFLYLHCPGKTTPGVLGSPGQQGQGITAESKRGPWRWWGWLHYIGSFQPFCDWFNGKTKQNGLIPK